MNQKRKSDGSSNDIRRKMRKHGLNKEEFDNILICKRTLAWVYQRMNLIVTKINNQSNEKPAFSDYAEIELTYKRLNEFLFELMQYVYDIHRIIAKPISRISKKYNETIKCLLCELTKYHTCNLNKAQESLSENVTNMQTNILDLNNFDTLIAGNSAIESTSCVPENNLNKHNLLSLKKDSNVSPMYTDDDVLFSQMDVDISKYHILFDMRATVTFVI